MLKIRANTQQLAIHRAQLIHAGLKSSPKRIDVHSGTRGYLISNEFIQLSGYLQLTALDSAL
jgi:CHASE3 domain sensor protein